MGGFSKKIIGVLKVIFPFIIENWQTLIAFSGVVITGILAGLGLFFNIFRTVIRTCVVLPLWVIITISPFLIYAVIMAIVKLAGVFRKPPFLSFTAMDYLSTKNYSYKVEWGYIKGKNNKYIPTNIHAVCHDCGCKLTPLNSNFIYCPNCRKEFCEPLTEHDAIYNIIELKIRKKLFNETNR